jgi:RHS repeat-associated protein
MGVALASSTVSVNGNSPYRRVEYFRYELPVSNGSIPVWQSVTVSASGQSPNATGNIYVPKTPEQFTYDADGNLSTDGRWNYTWDAENRLISMQAISTVPTAAKLKLDFEYDWRGRRIRKDVSTWNTGTSSYQLSTSRKFVYDQWNLIATLNSSSSLLQSFVWGTDLSGTAQGAGGVGGLLAIGDSTQGTHFISFDGNGNVSALVKASDGTTSSIYEYSPFGELLRATGPMGRVNPLRFSATFQDDESDLLYYGYRYYQPDTARWLSRDPAGEEAGAASLYSMLDGDAVNRTDTLGLCGSCAAGHTAAVSGGAAHTCPVGKLDFKREPFKRIKDPAEIHKLCDKPDPAPGCSGTSYSKSMKCQSCKGCGAWKIVLNINADCHIWFLDPKVAPNLQYLPDFDHMIKHEDCHCDDWEAAYQAVIASVGAVSYGSKEECNKAKEQIDVKKLAENQMGPSFQHVGQKWKPGGSCFGEWQGTY